MLYDVTTKGSQMPGQWKPFKKSDRVLRVRGTIRVIGEVEASFETSVPIMSILEWFRRS